MSMPISPGQRGVAQPPSSVVLISAVFPEPRDSGKKVMLASMLGYWYERVGAENVHLLLVGSDQVDTLAVEAVVHRVQRPSPVQQVASTLRRTVFTGSRTLQESMLYSASVRDELATILDEIAADLEIFDTVRMAQFAEEIPARSGVRRVVFLDDLFSVRYERMLTLLRDHPDVELDPLGDFRAHLPRSAARLADTPLVRRTLLRWERWLVSRRERQTALRFQSTLLVSPEEVRRLAQLVPSARVREFPPTITLANPGRRPDSREPTFVMVGLLTLAHNLDAVRVFLDAYMPAVLELMPKARLHIVGRGAPDSLHRAAGRYGDAVSVDGYVSDLDGLLARATALVMPLRFGSGVKIKVIEALAHGLPVVSTPVGAEGLQSGADRGVLVESDLDRFAAAMVSLTDPATNYEVSGAARRHYEERYTEHATFPRYDEAFGL